MSDKERQNYIIIETVEGNKIEGALFSIDKKNLTFKLTNAKKVLQDREEFFPILEIKKEEVKELKVFEIGPKLEKEETFDAIIPEDKKVDKKEDEKDNANIEKAYDKSKDFFDNLNGKNDSEEKIGSKNYNKKNEETFSLNEKEKYTNNKERKYNYQKWNNNQNWKEKKGNKYTFYGNNQNYYGRYGMFNYQSQYYRGRGMNNYRGKGFNNSFYNYHYSNSYYNNFNNNYY